MQLAGGTTVLSVEFETWRIAVCINNGADMNKPRFQMPPFVTNHWSVNATLTFCYGVGVSLKWVIFSSLVLVLAVLAAFFVTLAFNLTWCHLGWESMCNELYSIRENFTLIRNMVLGMVATVGLIFAYRRIRQSEEIQQHELHRLGATLLGAESLATRVAGISTLRQLKIRNPTEFLVPIMDLLAVYIVNSESKNKPTKLKSHFTIPDSKHLSKTKTDALLVVRADVTEAIVVISERDDYHRKMYGIKRNKRTIDLARASLNGLNLHKVNLFDVFFFKAELVCATFVESDLRKSNFSDSFLVGASFKNSNCSNAKFIRAIMCKSKFIGTILEEALFISAYLEGANLSGAVMNKSNLKDADLTSANLESTSLYYADLEGADLRHANLDRAILEDADLSGADLRNVKCLKSDQLKYICHRHGEEPKVDKGVVWDYQAAVNRWKKKWENKKDS